MSATNFVVRLKHGNAIPVLATSPDGEKFVYNSIRIFTQDTIGLSKRSTAQRRVAKGGGEIAGWYVEAVKPTARAQFAYHLAQLQKSIK